MPSDDGPAQRPLDPALIEHRDLTFDEARILGRRRLWRTYVPLVLVLLLGGYFGGRPAWRAAKAFQARRIAGEANALIEEEKWADASKRASDAMMLSFTEPASIRVNAHLLSRVGRSNDAVRYWKELEKIAPLSVDDRREFAGSALGIGDLDNAALQLQKVVESGVPPKAGDALLASQISAGKSDFKTSGEKALLVIAENSGASPRERFIASMLLVNLPQSEGKREAVRQLVSLARGSSPLALDALVWEARRVRPGTPSDPDRMSPAEIVQTLEQNPKSTISHKLLALDVIARTEPTRREEVILTAI